VDLRLSAELLRGNAKHEITSRSSPQMISGKRASASQHLGGSFANAGSGDTNHAGEVRAFGIESCSCVFVVLQKSKVALGTKEAAFVVRRMS